MRTLLTLGVGAAMGAGVTYLSDPDLGEQRRVEVRHWAVARSRQQARDAAAATLRAGRSYASAAAEGFRESRQGVETGV